MAFLEHPYIGSSAADAEETSRFRLRPTGFAETGRSMKSTGKPVDEIRPGAYESAAFAAHELPPTGSVKKENHLRFSQVVLFTGEAKAERKIIILHSDFCILHFYKSQFVFPKNKKSTPL